MSFESNLPLGVLTASLTPMNNDLSVNHGALVAHIQHLLDNGSDGICLLGTTGEANSLSLAERLKVIDKVIEGGINPENLLIGTGCCAYPDTIELTKLAVTSGAGGVLMLPPFYYKGLTDEGVLDYFKLVVDGVADKNLKIYLYHFPKMTGVPFTISLVEKLVKTFPGIVVGMKDSSGDWKGMQTMQMAIPEFRLYAGSETFLLDTMRIGGAGCISATANATIKLIADLYKNWESDNSNQLQENLTKVRQAFEVTSFVSGLKYLMAQWTKDNNWLNIRPPNSLPGPSDIEMLTKNLGKVGFRLG